GVDSVMAPRERRVAAWDALARELDAGKIEAITQDITLAEAIERASALLAGQVRGRLVVNVNAQA
ncbi:MAG TPA: oxidoreductase, partial [Noviherbaspirillum sp.]|nr:oxidoreductase [Noviherbaspirillum sp.]